jgi:TRIAD3 protein (E3 ubiquitin-protein ligase RNF216)
LSRLGILKDEYLQIPQRHIEKAFYEQKTLFDAHATLRDQFDNFMFSKVRRPREKRGCEEQWANDGTQLHKELRAARQNTEHEAGMYAIPIKDRVLL